MSSKIICSALRQRNIVRFYYKDNATATVVEPYTYGINKSGHKVLSAWLVSGATHDLEPPFWRLYLEGDMRRVEALPATFANRQGYNPNDSRFQYIECRLAPQGA